MADYESKKYGAEDPNGQPEPLANYELHQDPRSDETDASSSHFELEQEQGVSRIEALCESSRQPSSMEASLLTVIDGLETL
jgi:hypothetical protein